MRCAYSGKNHTNSTLKINTSTQSALLSLYPEFYGIVSALNILLCWQWVPGYGAITHGNRPVGPRSSVHLASLPHVG